MPPQDEIECITFPWPGLSEKYRNIARWINVYDPDDILGYPLRNLWTDSHGTLIEDRVIDVGFGPISGTPLSHAFYHSSRKFINIIMQQINANLAATEQIQ